MLPRMEKKRLTVNLEPSTRNILTGLAEEEGITYTEAVRRGVALFAYVLEQQKKGNTLSVRDPEGAAVRVVRIM